MPSTPEPLTGPDDPVRDPPAEQPDPARRRRRRLLVLLGVLSITILAADQLTKAWALAALAPGGRITLVGHVLGLSLVLNPGAALSIATGMTWVLTLVACTVAVVIVRASRRIGSGEWALALGLLLGGALGNLVDRVVREPGPGRGEVVDFIAYGNLFVGNVADLAIVVAAGLIVLLTVRGIGIDGSRDERPPREAAPVSGVPDDGTGARDAVAEKPADV